MTSFKNNAVNLVLSTIKASEVCRS